MAKGDGQTLEKLYIELGLDLSQLQADILAADKTVTENLGRLNREKNTIRLRMEADTAGLDRVKDATKILEIQEKALNQELTLSKTKLAILEAAYQQVANNANATAMAIQKAEQAFLREKIAVGQLEQELRALASQNAAPTSTNALLSGYLNIKGNVTGTLQEITTAFSNLKDATASADNALVSVLGVVGSLPNPVAKAAAALAGLPIIFKGIENSIVDMIEATASTGDSIYVMSRGFQMSIADTGKFTAMCKTAGVDVNDLATTIKRLQQTIIRGGEDAKGEKWLNQYGESAFDASGHLKDLNAMTMTLNRALKAAQAEGNGMAFILGTMRSASADTITTLEDAEGVYEQIKGLTKNGLLDPKFAHEVQGNLNALNLQASYMNATFKSALLPVANEIIPRVTERMSKLTQIIADNKDMIREFGRTAADAFLKIEEAAETVGKAVVAVARAYYDWQKNPRQDKIVEKYKNDTSIESVDDLIRKEQPTAFDVIKANPNLYNQTLAIYEPIFRALKDVQDEIKRKNEALAKELGNLQISGADGSVIGQARRVLEQNPEMLDTLRRARKYREEAESIITKLNQSDYENKKLDLFNWYNNLVREEEKSTAEREAIEELYSAKLEQIERERADKIEGIRKSVDAEFKTSVENRVAKIEEEKEAWISAGMEEAEATELSQRRITDIVKKADEEMLTAIQSHHQTELEQRLSQIDKEREAWIDKCNDEVKATQWAEQAKIDAQRDAAMLVIKQQAEEFEAFQKGGYEGLRAYKYAQLAEQGVNLSYLNMTPEQLQQFQRANQTVERSLMPNFMTAEDKVTHQQLIDESKAFRRDLAGMQDEKNYVIVDGKKIGMNEALYGKDSIAPTKFTVNNAEFEITDSGASQLVSDYDKDGKPTQQVYRRFDYDEQGHISGGKETQADYQFSNGKTTVDMTERDYFPPPDDSLLQSFSDLPQTVMDVSETLSEIPPAVQSVIESLNDFPVVVQGISESLTDLTQMDVSVREVTVKLSDLNQAIANLNWQREDSTHTEQRTPVNVNVTVEIKEAHAWDSEHIQELSDRVADEIEPVIISAIGGDSNSY